MALAVLEVRLSLLGLRVLTVLQERMVAIQHSARHLQHTVVSAEYSDQVQAVNPRPDRKESAKEVLHQMLLALLVGQ